MGFTDQINEIMKSINDSNKLNYFKSELIKILENKEKQENRLSKSIQDYFNQINLTFYGAGIEKGKLGVVGEIRTWKDGKKYKKMPNGKWVRVYQGVDRHAEISIARLIGKVKNAKTVDELMNIVMNNIHRFEDENGRILPIVEELKKEVAVGKTRINAGKPSTQEQIEKFKADKKNKEENEKLKTKKKKAKMLSEKQFLRLANFIKNEENSFTKNANNAMIYLQSSENANDSKQFLIDNRIKDGNIFSSFLIKNALYGAEEAVKQINSENNEDNPITDEVIKDFIKNNEITDDIVNLWNSTISDCLYKISYPDYPKSKKIKALEKLIEYSESSEIFKLLLSKKINKELLFDNYAEVISEYALKYDCPFSVVKKVYNGILKQRKMLKEQKENFHKFHKEPVTRDLSQNRIAKATSFDDIDHIFNNMGVKFDKLLKLLDFESVKASCIGIEEFMNEFPFPENMKLKEIQKVRGIDFFMSHMNEAYIKNNKVDKPYAIGISAKLFKENVQNYLLKMKNQGIKRAYFHAGDGNATVESMGFHEMAHALASCIRNKFDINEQQIVDQAFYNIKNQYNLSKDELSKTISGYAADKDCELFAEAFTDYYIYGIENCSPYSKEIVRIAKEYYNKLIKE